MLVSDSTNAERPGQTPSERSIYGTIDGNLSERPSRSYSSAPFLRVYTVSSNSSTWQVYTADLLLSPGVLSSTMCVLLLNSVTSRMNPDYLIDARDTSMFKPHEVMILSTGSQGEPRSALSLMALDNHPFLKVERGDTVVISARIIPRQRKGYRERR